MSSNIKPAALVTGCSEPSSLGTAIALDLRRRGWRVFATARKLDTMRDLERVGCDILELDIVSSASVAAAAQKVGEVTDGTLDLIVNNAGVTGSAPLLHTDPERVAAMFDVNVLGALRVVQAFTPMLVKGAQAARSPSKRSRIVNVGTVLSSGAPWHMSYSATKAGLQAMSDAMRREFAPLGIDVITLELGLVKTAMAAGLKEFSLDFPKDHKLPTYYENWESIISQVRESFKPQIQSAPESSAVARQIVDAVHRPAPSRKIWLGASAFLFKSVLPMIPIKFADGIWAKVMSLHLIQKPTS